MDLQFVKSHASTISTCCPVRCSRQLLAPFWITNQPRRVTWTGLARQYSCPIMAVRNYSMKPKSCKNISTSTSDIRHTAEATLAGVLLHGATLKDAYAAESLSNESLEAVSRAPQWLAPSVLAFPVFSYVLFNIYRDKVGFQWICMYLLLSNISNTEEGHVVQFWFFENGLLV
eukprot:Gb_18900 [translate_table: standard]